MSLQLMDGGMGYELFRLGVPRNEKIWSAIALVDSQYHEHVINAHLNFLRSGAKYITTNNYGVIPSYLEKSGLLSKFTYLTKLSGELAKKAVDIFSKISQEDITKPMILGSLPPLVESYRHDLLLSRVTSRKFYKKIIETLENDVDGYIAETIPSIEQLNSVVNIVSRYPKKFFLACTVNSSGQLRSNEDVNDVIEVILQQAAFPTAILFNCSHPEFITKALKNINNFSMQKLQQNNISLGAYANRFSTDPSLEFELENTPVMPNLRKDITPESYLDYAKSWKKLGCSYIGGCCGISPEYINYLNINF